MSFKYLGFLLTVSSLVTGCGGDKNDGFYAGVSLGGTGTGRGASNNPPNVKNKSIQTIPMEGGFKWIYPTSNKYRKIVDNCNGIEREVKIFSNYDKGEQQTRFLNPIVIEVTVKNTTPFLVEEHFSPDNIIYKYQRKVKENSVVELLPNECKIYRMRYEITYNNKIENEWSFNYTPQYFSKINSDKAMVHCEGIEGKILYRREKTLDLELLWQSEGERDFISFLEKNPEYYDELRNHQDENISKNQYFREFATHLLKDKNNSTGKSKDQCNLTIIYPTIELESK